MDTTAVGVSPEEGALLARARDVAGHAHAPYSRFHVGAALRTESGGVFVGCNVENASYGLTLCAERNAIAAAVASEGPGMRIASIAVAVDADAPFPPCGACRQVMAEFAMAETPVIYAARDGMPHRTTVGELLPQAFRLG